MPRYKDYCYAQGKLVPVSVDRQILPGTFAYTLNCLVDHEFDLSIFEARYHNDDTGAPAHDPAILLKIVLYACSRGVVSSREIFTIDGCKLPYRVRADPTRANTTSR